MTDPDRLAPEIRRLLDQWREQARKDHATRHDDVEDGVWAYQHEASGRSRQAFKCADELEAALLALPADRPPPDPEAYREQLRKHIAAIDGRRPQNGHSERGFSTCPHPDCAAMHPATTLANGPIGDLMAYGEEEAANALTRKDRDRYQFWQGWNAALQRVPAPADRPPPEALREDYIQRVRESTTRLADRALHAEVAPTDLPPGAAPPPETTDA